MRLIKKIYFYHTYLTRLISKGMYFLIFYFSLTFRLSYFACSNLVEHWMKKYMESPEQYYHQILFKTNHNLDLDHLKAIFAICLYGSIIAFIVLIFEFIFKYIILR